MTERKLFGPERKPWEDSADERLAPSSYAAVALFGIVELAVEHIHEQGAEPSAPSVGLYSRLFARVLIKAQTELGSGGGWASSLNTRLRGALRTAITVTSYDLSDQETPQESLDAWEERLYELVTSIAKTAAWLHSKKPVDL